MPRPAPLTFSDADPALTRATRDLPPDARAAIAKWIELLCAWNARIDLTAARTGDELVDLMLADALAIGPRIAPGARVVDVGTGAGAPGLALALARPDLAVTMCEPLAKRASFLRTVLGTLGRADVTLVAKKGEELAAGAWDVATSRATLAPPSWLALGAKLVRPGGEVWVLLAKDEPPSMAGVTAFEDTAYTWPATGAARRAVRYRRDDAGITG
jgi:16S rRNA (guanine527-N7)-methyltransferase